TKTTVADLALVRAWGIDGALAARARRGDPVLGICGGYQMLGRTISDHVESCAGVVEGLGLLPVKTIFEAEKVLARSAGTCPLLGDTPATGYEIRHGRVTVHGGAPLLDPPGDGCTVGAVLGTSWHGLLEGDELRRALLAWVAERRGLDFVPAETHFAAVREARLDALGDLVEHHVDLDALTALLVRWTTPTPPPARPPLTE
ncbi:MAG: cobyric acid synthase, partial [Egibacteraceae bacterium]